MLIVYSYPFIQISAPFGAFFVFLDFLTFSFVIKCRNLNRGYQFFLAKSYGKRCSSEYNDIVTKKVKFRQRLIHNHAELLSIGMKGD